MRPTVLVLNSIIVVFFVCFLGYTFIARHHLESLARGFVTEKTLAYSELAVDTTDEALNSPLAQKLLTGEQSTAIRNEIVDYRKDPKAYIADLTGQRMLNPPRANANPLMAKVASIKSKIRTYYDETLDALIADLRIFSLSNLVAGLVAFGLAYYSRSEIREPIVWFSFLMFVAVLYCSYMYVDDITFFRILFRTHMGWWYAGLLIVVTVGLTIDFGRSLKSKS